VWRYHPFFTNSDEPLTDADITHRRHAIIETTFADLIDGPWHICLRALRRQLGLGAMRRIAPQSAARRGNTGRPRTCRRARRHSAPQES